MGMSITRSSTSRDALVELKGALASVQCHKSRQRQVFPQIMDTRIFRVRIGSRVRIGDDDFMFVLRDEIFAFVLLLMLSFSLGGLTLSSQSFLPTS